jgi:hypothetical protein
MKTRFPNTQTRAPKSFAPVLAWQIHMLIEEARAARAGAAQMTLDDWRDVEQQLQQRMQNEKFNM